LATPENLSGLTGFGSAMRREGYEGGYVSAPPQG
jgi:hypothetical protein